MDKIFFGIIILHLIIGFGWLIYKLEVPKNKSKDDENNN